MWFCTRSLCPGTIATHPPQSLNHVAARAAARSSSMTAFRATNVLLNEAEVRVLGSLVEKDITTPDYYPLSINALVNACNQKSNREPVMNLNEETVRQALHSLATERWPGRRARADSRVTKYEHRMQEAFNFTPREMPFSAC